MTPQKGLYVPEREGAPVVDDDHPDAELIARVAEFYPALEKHNIASEAWDAGRAEADAMPDCPPDAIPADDKAAHDRWHAFMKAKGVWKLSDKTNAAGRAMGKAANAVFAIPARTYRGAAEKVKIAYLATGDGEGTGTGDGDLESYQDIERPWMANAIADLERLAGVTEPDPVVTMSAEWGIIHDEMTTLSAANPESKSGENMDRWEAALERVRALEERIIETPATSIAGVAIKLRIASDRDCDSANLSTLHATPAREIDYEKECIVVEWTSKAIISALIDAERLAGV